MITLTTFSYNDEELGKKIIYYFTKYNNKPVDIKEIADKPDVSPVPQTNRDITFQPAVATVFWDQLRYNFPP